jgi:cytochrome c oxidase subunit 2
MVPPDKEQVADTTPTVEPTPPGTAEEVPQLKVFTMTARQWEFIPDVIEVNEGDQVKLMITSIDVAHGFSLPAFDINERLEPNQEVVIEFVADRKGTFNFRCNVFCGSGHGSMDGQIIVS